MLFEVKNIVIAAPFEKVYGYLSDKTKLPEWTNAFAEVKASGEGVMRTPNGEVPVRIKDLLNKEFGIIDTVMTFPNGDEGIAMSRLMPLDETSCLYSFTLTPPPVALEELEGALAEQAVILEGELKKLKALLEG